MSKPDTKKFFENLSGAGKAIAVLTSGGDAQGTVSGDVSKKRLPSPYICVLSRAQCNGASIPYVVD